jgi:hypothetical protein
MITVDVGDKMHCPQCTRMGTVVWVSKDGKSLGVKCSASHQPESIPNAYGFTHPQSKAHKNCVFLVRTQTV